MNIFLRSLILYTSLITTVVLIILLLQMRTLNKINTNLPQEVNNLRKEVEKLSSNASSSGKLSDEIEKIKSELLESSAEASVKGVQSAVSGYITIQANTFQTVDAFHLTSFSSPIVGQIQAGNSYGYTKKENNWYLISLPEKEEGWVNSRFVTEVKDTQDENSE